MLKITAYSSDNDPIVRESTDIDGHDLYEVHHQPMASCAQACRNDYRCVAYAWNSFMDGTCYLKDGYTPTVARANTWTGIMNDVRSGRLESKQTFTPLTAAGKQMRVEFVARWPSAMGAWPALWILGQSGVYGGWPHDGEIDVLEWVWQLQDSVQQALHWNSSSNLATVVSLSMADMSAQWTTYGVEYSAQPDNAYVQFYVTYANGFTQWGPKWGPSVWQSTWRPNPSCNASVHGPCTPLAPFDSEMTLVMNVAVGGDWGGCCGVNSYQAFDGAGVSMLVKSVRVQSLM